MANASIAIQVLPHAEGAELIRIVDEAIAAIKATGLRTVVGPFETTVEGDFDQLMDLIKECQLTCIRAGAPSLMSYIKISYNPEGSVLSIDEKISKHQ
jgi:uncharacterized protein YqgV (UPF0045/DUF77 family)